MTVGELKKKLENCDDKAVIWVDADDELQTLPVVNAEYLKYAKVFYIYCYEEEEEEDDSDPTIDDEYERYRDEKLWEDARREE